MLTIHMCIVRNDTGSNLWSHPEVLIHIAQVRYIKSSNEAISDFIRRVQGVAIITQPAIVSKTARCSKGGNRQWAGFVRDIHNNHPTPKGCTP